MTSEHAVKQTEAESATKPKPILRGLKKNEQGQYDTTVLLFQGKGDYLQGFIVVDGQRRHVLAQMNQRKPDATTGLIKPNFISLSEPHLVGDRTDWHQIGFGNAINRRSDGKALYFDEVIFNIGHEVLRARVTQHVDAALHRKLGFADEKKERPKNDPGSTPSNIPVRGQPIDAPSETATDDDRSKERGASDAQADTDPPEAQAPAEPKSGAAGVNHEDAGATTKPRRRSPRLSN